MPPDGQATQTRMGLALAAPTKLRRPANRPLCLKIAASSGVNGKFMSLDVATDGAKDGNPTPVARHT